MREKKKKTFLNKRIEKRDERKEGKRKKINKNKTSHQPIAI